MHCDSIFQPNNDDIVKRVLGGEKPGAKASSSADKEKRSRDRDSSADKRKRREKEVSAVKCLWLRTLVAV